MPITTRPFGLVIALAIILTAVLLSYQFLFVAPIKSDCTDFLTALCTGDKVTEFATGKVAWTLSQQKNLPGADIIDINIYDVTHSKRWAQAHVFTELRLQDNSIDVSWYQLNLIKDDNWKVVSIKPIDCPLTGIGWHINKGDVQEAQDVLDQYIVSVSDNRYGDAARYLAGPARVVHEKQKHLFKDSSVLGLQKEKIIPVWQNGKKLVARIEPKGTPTLLVFYKTSDGWKIINA